MDSKVIKLKTDQFYHVGENQSKTSKQSSIRQTQKDPPVIMQARGLASQPTESPSRKKQWCDYSGEMQAKGRARGKKCR